MSPVPWKRRFGGDRADTLGLWFWGGFTVLAGLVLVFVVFLVLRNEVLLDVHHDRAVGVVLEVRPGKGGGSAKVRYSPRGQAPVTTTVELSMFDDLPRIGDRLEIEYDPRHPDRARRAGAHDISGLVLFAGVAIGGTALTATWDKRRRRRRPHRRGTR